MDIREFYDAGGEEKPGKKGISLTQEQVRHISQLGNFMPEPTSQKQWNTLKTNMDIIDTLVAKVQKK